ncbi:hypothetical protein [Moorena sp. SIOASIH]|uniref:hypothetical protein n=1 Tax=Moorena sp. SIOASIH TaxID=2607817 RepID=UPI0013C71045|nr:hypothetical protein [Moorena sp. SIOASIH]NEO89491.1 hypothetical protein [Moorena sp. SIO3G5]
MVNKSSVAMSPRQQQRWKSKETMFAKLLAKLFAQLKQVPLGYLMVMAAIAMALDLYISTSVTPLMGVSFLMCLVVGVKWIGVQPSNSGNQIQRLVRKYGLGACLFLFAFLWFMLDFTAAPAHAQFFQVAEDWLTSAIPEVDADLVSLVFNVLRALFLIYLGISLVKVVNAAQQDDDWKTLARTPIIILIVVTLGDLLAGYITGTGA